MLLSGYGDGHIALLMYWHAWHIKIMIAMSVGMITARVLMIPLVLVLVRLMGVAEEVMVTVIAYVHGCDHGHGIRALRERTIASGI